MTTREAIYKTALEHIRACHDSVCLDCGWMGPIDQAQNPESVFPLYKCPQCGSGSIMGGQDEIAAYALAQGEKGE